VKKREKDADDDREGERRAEYRQRELYCNVNHEI
jgi:hypothetical protein